MKHAKQVLKAFVHGDGNLLNSYPELQEALVWVYFHSNIQEFNKMECWGPLKEAVEGSRGRGGEQGSHLEIKEPSQISNWELPDPCQENCNCCFPPMSSIPWPQKLPHTTENLPGSHQSLQEQA